MGPLAGINEAIVAGGISAKAGIPLWVMVVGAIGISLGLALYGPKLIRTVDLHPRRLAIQLGEELPHPRAVSTAIARRPVR